MISLTRDGSVETPHGQRYIKMFSGHWARKFDIRPQDEGTRIVFPKEDDDPDYPEEAIATLRATESRLDVQPPRSHRPCSMPTGTRSTATSTASPPARAACVW